MQYGFADKKRAILGRLWSADIVRGSTMTFDGPRSCLVIRVPFESEEDMQEFSDRNLAGVDVQQVPLASE